MCMPCVTMCVLCRYADCRILWRLRGCLTTRRDGEGIDRVDNNDDTVVENNDKTTLATAVE